MKKYLIEITWTVLVLQLAWCGTLFYPERRGQEQGRIDPAVAILDGLGLLLFIIPGVIAFAVDFSTGAIYLPPEQISMVTGDEPDGAAKPENKVVYLNQEHLSLSGIEDAVAKETLLAIDLNSPNVRTIKYDSRWMLWGDMAKVNEKIELGSTTTQAAR